MKKGENFKKLKRRFENFGRGGPTKLICSALNMDDDLKMKQLMVTSHLSL